MERFLNIFFKINIKLAKYVYKYLASLIFIVLLLNVLGLILPRNERLKYA